MHKLTDFCIFQQKLTEFQQKYAFENESKHATLLDMQANKLICINFAAYSQ